jgi:hypothetical protein
MQLDLTDEETFALLNLLIETIEADRYLLSPRIRSLKNHTREDRAAARRHRARSHINAGRSAPGRGGGAETAAARKQRRRG